MQAVYCYSKGKRYYKHVYTLVRDMYGSEMELDGIIPRRAIEELIENEDEITPTMIAIAEQLLTLYRTKGFFS